MSVKKLLFQFSACNTGQDCNYFHYTGCWLCIDAELAIGKCRLGMLRALAPIVAAAYQLGNTSSCTITEVKLR